MIIRIEHEPLHRLLEVLYSAVRDGNYQNTQGEAMALLEQVVLDAHAGDEALQSFLTDVIGEVPATISGDTLNTIVDNIWEARING